jgi:DNA-binding CsgD family transcriptional regulator
MDNNLAAQGPDSGPGAAVHPNCGDCALALAASLDAPGTVAGEAREPARRSERHARPDNSPLRRHEEGIYRLWDELADFGPDATGEALKHCMRTICGWIGADNAYWIGIVRLGAADAASPDPVDGWRIGRIDALNPASGLQERLQANREPPTAFTPPDTARAVVAGAGQFRSYSLGTGIVDLEAFRQTGYYAHFYRELGVADRIWVVFPVSADAESCFVFDRCDDSRPFGTRALHLATEALRGIKWFHRQQLLSHGLGICSAPLTQAERRILPELLSGASEKLIAHRLGLTQGTVHQYVTSLYRKFGVRGRAEFMALWLRGNGQAPPTD